MPDLTFGEQVKIVLGRKGMTIKELAEMIEQHTNKKMSRQNLTQRLGRDNFQEQDMRMIASILECPFRLSILGEDTPDEKEIADIAVKEVQAAVVEKEEVKTEEAVAETEQEDMQEPWKEEILEKEIKEEDAGKEDSGREITVGEFLEIRKSSGESAQEKLMQELLAEMDSIEREGRERSEAWEMRRQKKEQQEIIDAMEATQCTPSLSQAIRIKKLSETGKLTESEAEGILGEIKQKEADRVVFKNEQLYRFFPSTYTSEQMRREILEILKSWRNSNWI